MIESNDQEWGLRDHYLVAQDLDDDAEEDYGDEDDESPWEHLARVAADIEAGRAEVPRGLGTRPARPRHPGVDHPVGPTLRLHSDRRMAAGAHDEIRDGPGLAFTHDARRAG